jgi:hypothetical protein
MSWHCCCHGPIAGRKDSNDPFVEPRVDVVLSKVHRKPLREVLVRMGIA